MDEARIEQHFAELKRWLQWESKAEEERLREDLLSGRRSSETSLLHLSIDSEFTGLGGRHVISFRSRGPLPFSRLNPGSPVLLSLANDLEAGGARGVVSAKHERGIEVAFDEPPDLGDSSTFRLDLAPDESSRRRELTALSRTGAAKKNRLAELRDKRLGLSPFVFVDSAAPEIRNDKLNDSQKDAVAFALSAEDFAIIHGPPGTGKTTTLIEIVHQLVLRREKVLVAAPSNLGVDNMLAGLLDRGIKAVRLGHPARVQAPLHAATLDIKVEAHDDARLARKMQKEASVLFRDAQRYKRTAPPKGYKGEMIHEARALMRDARELEQRAIERVLDEADVICSTLTGLDDFLLGQRRFATLVVDEAGQCTEPSLWIAMQRAQRVILGGDHCQLPATVLSADAAAAGLGRSLMEQLAETHRDKLSRLLERQYRMHQTIMEFPSQTFYEGRLIADESARDRDMASLLPALADEAPLLFIDTAGAGFDEAFEDGERGSRLNPGEAKLIQRELDRALASGLKAEQIAIISPYAAQVRLLRELCGQPGLEIDSIDGFQGREKELVLLSLVRSNPEQELGFLRETRRLNVAITRARRALRVVGDSATLSGDPFFQDYLEYLQSHDCYASIWDYAPEIITT